MVVLPSCQLICTAAQQIWPHHWIGLEKLSQFDLLHVKVCGIYPNLWWFYLHVSWFVQLNSGIDLTTGLALGNYPNLTFYMLKSVVSISTYDDFDFMSADLYSWTAELTSPSNLSWKSNHSWCLTCCNLTCNGKKIYQIIPNPPKPNQIHSKVIVVSQLLIWTTFTLDILLILGLISEFYQTKPYQTKPNNL